MIKKQPDDVVSLLNDIQELAAKKIQIHFLVVDNRKIIQEKSYAEIEGVGWVDLDEETGYYKIDKPDCI